MAKRVITVLTDDISGKEGNVETISFSIDGNFYEIDLGQTNARAFRKAFEQYTKIARKVRGGSNKKGKRVTLKSRSDLAEIRDWAKGEGIEVSDRGRVAQEVIDRYDAR